MIKKLTFKNKTDLVNHLKTHKPSFYFSSQTSTVIPYDHLNELFKTKDQEFYLGDLTELPKKMELLQNGDLKVSGPINWKEARDFLKAHGRNIMTAPTEELALITAGVATSATGERCFSFGTLRSQIVNLQYLDFNGEEHTLDSSKPFKDLPGLKKYQEKFKQYEKFKNAPYPRFLKETDLLTGTEGQLGLISDVQIKTTTDDPVTHLFILLPKWEQDYTPHLEVFNNVQPHREHIIICELLDSNSINYLKNEDRIGKDQDVIFLEIKNEALDFILENLLGNLKKIKDDQFFEISSSKFHQIRSGVPRAVFEKNSQMGVKKMGTDVQVPPDQFKNLLDYYRDFAKTGVGYNLFGHFGDAHLHFNFMPKPNETDQCKKYFEKLYLDVKSFKGSPFAEHGIGLLKKDYISQYYPTEVRDFFKTLKSIHDPHNQFFPQGFMA